MTLSGAGKTESPHPPPAQGVRLDWPAVPEQARAAVEAWLGSPIVSIASQPSGFSPGVAARLGVADGRRVFVKAIGPEPNPTSPRVHRKEARIVAALPVSAPVPRLLWSYDEGGWVVLVFEMVEGRHPAQPWRPDELERVLDTMTQLATLLTPSPLSAEIVGTAGEKIDRDISGWRRLRDDQTPLVAPPDAWSVRHLQPLAELEATAASAVDGNTLVHFDLRADNILLTPDRVWVVDWPHACIGAAWLDVVFAAPAIHMQGGPPPEALIARNPAARAADPAAITAAVAAVAGFFTERSLEPPPPGLPTVRAFQAAQGVVAREWLAERTGWR